MITMTVSYSLLMFQEFTGSEGARVTEIKWTDLVAKGWNLKAALDEFLEEKKTVQAGYMA